MADGIGSRARTRRVAARKRWRIARADDRIAPAGLGAARPAGARGRGGRPRAPRTSTRRGRCRRSARRWTRSWRPRRAGTRSGTWRSRTPATAAAPARAAFFPLYPLLVRAALGSRGSPLVGGVVDLVRGVRRRRSCCCTGSTALELGPEAARPAVLALALFPGSLCFSAVYSEALFLAALGRRGLRGAHRALGVGRGARRAGARRRAARACCCSCRWRCCGSGARARRRCATARGWRSCPPAWRRSAAYLALAGDDALAPLHAQDALVSRRSRARSSGVWDGAVAALDGARQLLSAAAAGLLRARRAATRSRSARHNLVLFAFLVLAVPAVVGALRRLPLAYGAYARGRARAAAVLSGRPAAADVAAALRGGAVPARSCGWAGGCARGAGAGAGARCSARSPRAWRRSARCSRPGTGWRDAVRAVLLDALGTLVELRAAGAARCVRELRERAASRSPRPRRARALRAEIAYYRAHHDEAVDRAALERPARPLRRGAARRAAARTRARRAGPARARCWRRCASGPTPRSPAALRALRDARRARCVVVSNWDVSLHERAGATPGWRALRRRRRHPRPRWASPSRTRRSSQRALALAGGAAPARRCTSATPSRPTSRARAPRGSAPCSSSRDGAAPPRRRAGVDLAGAAWRSSRPTLWPDDERAAAAHSRRRPSHPERPGGAPRAPPPAWRRGRPCRAARGLRRRARRRRWSLGVIAAAIFGARRSSDPPPAVDIVATVVQDVCLIGAALVFARDGARRRGPRQFGLRPPRAVAGGAATSSAATSPSSSSAAVWLAVVGNPHDEGHDPRGARRRARSTVALIAVTFLVTASSRRSPRSSSSAATSSARCATGRGSGPRRSSPASSSASIHASARADRVPRAAGLLRLRAVLVYASGPGRSIPCIGAALPQQLDRASACSENWGWQIPVVLVLALRHRRRALAAHRGLRRAIRAAPTPPRRGSPDAAARPCARARSPSPSARAPPPPPTPARPPPAPTRRPAAAPRRRPRRPPGRLDCRWLEQGQRPGATVLAGDRCACAATVTPYVAGPEVVVRFYRDGKKLGARRVDGHSPAPRAASGTFVARLTHRRRPGASPSARATARRPQLATLEARAPRVVVLPLRARPGSTGLAVRLLQQRARSARLRRRRAAASTTRAPAAPCSPSARSPAWRAPRSPTRDVFRRLAARRGRFQVRYPEHGKHVEADLSRRCSR